jgi:hypothetical protein
MYASLVRSQKNSTNKASRIFAIYNFLGLRIPPLEFRLHYRVEVGVGLLRLLQFSVISVYRMMPLVGLVHIILMRGAPMGKVVSGGVGYQDGPDKLRRT